MGYEDIKLGIIDRIRVLFGGNEEELLFQKKIKVATRDAQQEYKEDNAYGLTKEEYIEQFLIEVGLKTPALQEGREEIEEDMHQEFADKYKVDPPEIESPSNDYSEMKNTKAFENLLKAQEELVSEMELEYENNYVKGSRTTNIEQIKNDPELYKMLDGYLGEEGTITYKKLEEALGLLENAHNMYNEELAKSVGVEYKKETYEKSLNYLNELMKPKIEHETKLATEKQRKYELERYNELIPYIEVTGNGDFKEYTTRNYSVNPNVEEVNPIEIANSEMGAGYYNPAMQEQIVPWEMLTNEERAIYTYLYEKRGEEQAKKYITAMKDIINNRTGLKQSNDLIDKVVKNNGTLVDVLGDFGVTAGSRIYRWSSEFWRRSSKYIHT